MNFAFFGTDEFSLKVLDTLKNEGLLPSLIVTVPDKPKGRKLILTPPHAKIWAINNNIPYLQPAKLKSMIFPNPSTFLPNLTLQQWEIFVVASYGKIIPQIILDIPKFGVLNIHPSLLPKYRGPTPLQSAILSEDTETGVTIMLVDAEMDHGPILIQSRTDLKEKWYEELRDELAETGAKLLVKIIPDWLAGKIKPKEQDHSQATFTKKITKENGLIHLNEDPNQNFRKIRAFTPWPSTYFFDHQGKRIIIKRAHFNGSNLTIDRVIPEGKSEIDWPRNSSII